MRYLQMKLSKIYHFALSVILTLLPLCGHATTSPRVVVSIAPLHALVASVMEHVGTPTLLLQPGASPHHYSLKPSEAEQLYHADIIFWAGPLLETFLTQILDNAKNLKPSMQTIALVETPDLLLLPLRTGATFEPHVHTDGHTHDHDHAHDTHHAHSTDHHLDMHFWLDPMNAKILVTHIAKVLSTVDPIHAAQYKRNAHAAQQRLDLLDKGIRHQLLTVKTMPYIVFHDAYQYFEHRYGLKGVGAITLNPEVPPSAKRIKQIQAIIQSTHAVCVFSEPQFKSKIIDTIIQGTTVHTGELDPLGKSTHAGLDDYIALLENLASAFYSCLSKSK